jgi:hypothetical protein
MQGRKKMKIKTILLSLLVLFLILGYEPEEVKGGFLEDVNAFVVTKIVNPIAKLFTGGEPVGKPPNTHFTCIDGQCILVQGSGRDTCLRDSECTGSVNTCLDGTPFGSCVEDSSGKYCYGAITGGELIDKCSVCGCSSGLICGVDDTCSDSSDVSDGGIGGDGNDTGGEGGLTDIDVVDIDADGFYDTTDCDDLDPLINPMVVENCNDGKDNDCDGDVDSLDTDCSACQDGETRACGSDTGECSFGLQTCSGTSWGECEGGVGATREICDDGKDNNCDGSVDEGCVTGEEDSDGDGLPDDWEMENFGVLTYGWDDDPDGDGRTNAQEYAGSTNPTEPEKSTNTVLLGGALAGVIILIFLLFMLVAKKRNGHGKITDEKRIEVKDYINKAREKGFNDFEIKASLIRAGWKEKALKEFFNS